MSKYLWLILFFVSFVQVQAKSIVGDKLVQTQSFYHNKVVDTVKYIVGKASQPNGKFLYAELLYQRVHGEDKLVVNGNSISEVLKKSVAQAKYRDSALELLGAEGWELSSAVIRELNYGYEIFFYLKKRIE